MKKLFTVLLLALCLCGAEVSAYVAWDGKYVPPLPQPTGTVAICSTVAQFYMALRTQASGKTIMLKDGTYNIGALEPIRIDSPNVTIRGMSGNPTAVVFVGQGFEICGQEVMFHLMSHHTTFANVTLSEVRTHGIKLETGANHNTLLYNTRFINIGERMIKGPGVAYSKDWEIAYCHFENTKVPAEGRCDDIDNGNYIAGMDIMHATGWNVHDCVFRNIRGATGGGRGCIFFWVNDSNMTVQRNTFVGNDRAIAYGNPGASDCVIGGTIKNNFIVKGSSITIGIEICGCSGINIYNNTLYSNCATIHDCFRSLNVENLSNCTMRNNILFGEMTILAGSGPTDQNNIWKSQASDWNTNWFANRDNGDLHLTANASQAMDAGANGLVSDDWEGQARSSTPDIGADEYNPAGIEDRIAQFGNAEEGISATPNPFNPAVKISIPAIEGFTATNRVMIYNTTGRLIMDATSHLVNGSVTWDASAQPSGIYIVKALVNGQTYTKQITLLK